MKMRTDDPSIVPLAPGMTPLRWQVEAMLAIRRDLRESSAATMVSAATGCHARGQAIMLHDGQTIAVEDVVVGDKLMGPDSTPRTVLSLARGHDQMVRIVPVKGDPWVVNLDHVLSLVDTRAKTDDVLVDVTVREWLTWSATAKHLHKLVRRAVEYLPSDDAARPIPAYHLGLLIGDGVLGGGTISVTKPDPEVRAACEELAAHFGLSVREYASGAGVPQWRIVQPRTPGVGTNNRLVRAVAELGLRCVGEHRRIPDAYLYAPRTDRMALLAGLMDSDGHLVCGGYDWIAKGQGLAEDVTRLARSLGFAAYVKSCQKWSQFGGGTYWRVSISGDVGTLPVRIPRKQAAPRQQVKSVLRTGFRVEMVGSDDYYGFALDGDRRYLLGDFTVTHNTGKGTLAASLVVKACRAGSRVLFLVHMDELINDVMQRAVEIEPALYVGKVKAKLNEIDRHAVFASVQTLKGKRLDTLDPHPFDYVITDEAHHAVARSYQAIYARIAKVNPKWRHILLTATPFRNAGGGKTAGLGAVVNRLAYEYSLADAIAEGALCTLRGVSVHTEIDLSGVDPDDEEALEKEIDTPGRNRVVAEKYVEHCVSGGERTPFTVTEQIGDTSETVTRQNIVGGERKQAIVFACSIAHARKIAEELVKWGIVAEHVYGTDKERTRKIEAFKAGRIDVLSNNNLLSEGFDHKPTGAVLLVRPTQSRGLYAQQVGRATRKAKGKSEGLVIDFVANSDTHSLASLADLSRPDADRPRIEPGSEVRHRRDAAKSKGLVESVAGFVDADEQGTAMVLWRQGSADLGIVAPDAVEEECRNLVLVKPPPRATDEDEVVINPTVIGVNEFSISLFGEATGGKRVGWYTYTDARKRKHLVARGKQEGHSAYIRRFDDEAWEAWRRREDSLERVCVGTFAECEASVSDMKPDDYTSEWMRKPASEKQIATLAKFGVRREGLSRGEASMILEMKILQLRISQGQYAPSFLEHRANRDT